MSSPGSFPLPRSRRGGRRWRSWLQWPTLATREPNTMDSVVGGSAGAAAQTTTHFPSLGESLARPTHTTHALYFTRLNRLSGGRLLLDSSRNARCGLLLPPSYRRMAYWALRTEVDGRPWAKQICRAQVAPPVRSGE